MGVVEHGRPDSFGGGSLKLRAARVVPNVPSFAVDNGFWYSVPETIELEVGSQVRVPLAGRRVRGWVVEVGDRSDLKLKEVVALSGTLPVFDAAQLRSLTWAANHYVAPLPVVLAKASPPNLPKKLRIPTDPIPEAVDHPLTEVARASGRGTKQPTMALLGRWQDLDWIGAVSAVLSGGRSALVVAATAAEVAEIGDRARRILGDRVTTVPSEGDSAVTRAWEEAQAAGRLVVGTLRLAMWRIGGLALAIVLEEGRRAMKDRQTPTIHVREMMRTRSLVEGFNLVFFGPTPSVELLAAGASIVRVGRRPWGLVEVVDRTRESGGGLISDHTMAAMRGILSVPGETAFVLTGHKIAGSMVDEINRRLGKGAAAVLPDRAPILVGTERDLAGLDPVSLTVAGDVDFMVSGTDYRAGEEALRQLARLGNVLRPGSGRRMMLQTRHPESPIVGALRRGDPMPYLESVMVDRARSGMPPAVEMMAIEIREIQPDNATAEIAALPGVNVLGPMAIDDGRRWLVSGDLSVARKELRGLVGRWREAGATVRIDADPIDL